MSRLSCTLQEVVKYATNNLQFIPIITLKKHRISNRSTLYPIINCLGQKQINSNLAKLSTINIPRYNFDRHELVQLTPFQTDKYTTKLSIFNWIHQSVMDEKKINIFSKKKIKHLLNNIQKNDIYFIRIQNKYGFDRLNKYIFLIMAVSPITVRKQPKIEITGYKINCNILFRQDIWCNLDIIQQILWYNWCHQFGQYIISNNYKLGHHVCGYYYPMNIHHLYDTKINVVNFQLTPNSPPISIKTTPTVIRPFIEYDSDNKPLEYIELFKKKKPNNFKCKYYPICRQIMLNAINCEFGQLLKHHHLQWINSGMGYHIFNAERIKSMVGYKYWYKSEKYKQILKKWKNNSIVIAEENLAGGLRYIDNIPQYKCPQYLTNLIKLLQQKGRLKFNVNQIGINYYLYHESDPSNKKGYSYSQIESHEERVKFKKMEQLNAGMDTILSFDTIGGNCNGSVGMELPRNSLVEYNMDNYFMGASNINGRNKGGKHMICQRHLKMLPHSWRITWMFRECEPKCVTEAQIHNNVCKNNDFACHQLNKQLRSSII